MTPRSPALPVLAAVVLYVLRPFPYAFVLQRVGGERSPWDRHGFGALGDFLLTGVLALPLAGLLWWVALRWRPGQGLLATASTPAHTAASVLALLLLGAPLPAQWGALRLMAATDAWPVLLMVVAWFGAVVLLRAGAVTPPVRAGRRWTAPQGHGDTG